MLTEDRVAALPAKAKPYLVWDKGMPGLHVHVQAKSGTKTYRYCFRFAGAPQAISYKLGRWPGMELETARDLARGAAKAVAAGKDPREASVTPDRSMTFWELAEKWHERGLCDEDGKPNDSRDACLSLVKYHTKDWAKRAAGTVTDHEIDDLLQQLKAGQPATAARLYSHLAALFRWANRKPRKLPVNPMEGMKTPCRAPSRKAKVDKGEELQWLK